MTFLTLVVAVLNVCLGYALAVHLGYGTSGPEPATDGSADFDDSLVWGDSDDPLSDDDLGEGDFGEGRFGGLDDLDSIDVESLVL